MSEMIASHPRFAGTAHCFRLADLSWFRRRPVSPERVRKALGMSDVDWQPDILGDGYAQHVLDLGPDPDGEGGIQAVLVRRDQRPDEDALGVVLYVHGFSDYFFQTDLADFFAARGLAFYALDLRKCGRARRPGQTAHYVSDLALYDAELDRALDIVTAAHPGLPVIAAAHSTGGLVVPLWLHRRRAAGSASHVAGAVLNSPWLDLQGGALLRGPVTQLLRVLGKARPFLVIPTRPGVYGRTLHVSGTGEWDFDTELKPLKGFPVTCGWLNAVRRAHARLHRGVETGVPVLVLRANRSHSSARYEPLSDRADLVLDTAQIARWGGSLGSQVTDAPVDDARHDVFLSVRESRDRAYAAVDSWLKNRLRPTAGLGGN
jgi:alpha-beta hydrolase superfamily lysophospholipase